MAVCARPLASILEKVDIKEVRSAVLRGQCIESPLLEPGLADMSPVGDWNSSPRVLSSKDSVEAGEGKAGAKVPIAGLDGTDLSTGPGSTSAISFSPSAASPCFVAAAILEVWIVRVAGFSCWESSLLTCPTDIEKSP